jgi:hypothetical protein
VKNIKPRRVEERLISDEYVWSAIRYLDPDGKGEKNWSLLFATLAVGMIWGILILILVRPA